MNKGGGESSSYRDIRSGVKTLNIHTPVPPPFSEDADHDEHVVRCCEMTVITHLVLIHHTVVIGKVIRRELLCYEPLVSVPIRAWPSSKQFFIHHSAVLEVAFD